MSVDFRDLKWAIVVARHRSLRRAAEALGIRQSTLSRRLCDLERRIGVTLFERSNGGTRLTMAGTEFFRTAQRVIDEVNASLLRLKNYDRGEEGVLTIGVYASLSAGHLRAILMEHHQRFSLVNVQIFDGGREQLLSALKGDVIDIAILTSGVEVWDERLLPLWSERVIIAMPEYHPLATKNTITWYDIATEHVILSNRGPGPELERLLKNRLGQHPAIRTLWHSSGLDRLLSLVSARKNVLLMLEGGTGIRYEGITYREVHDSDGPVKFDFVAYWRQSNSNPAAKSFISMLRERYPDFSVS